MFCMVEVNKNQDQDHGWYRISLGWKTHPNFQLHWSQGTGFIQPNVGRATLSLSAESKRTSFFWRQKIREFSSYLSLVPGGFVT